MAEDDDFWNNSEVKNKALNFDDEELSSQQFSKLGAELRAELNDTTSYASDSKLNVNTQSLLPLNNLISDKTLKILLSAQSGENPPGVQQTVTDFEPNVSITLKRLVIGRRCSLQHYRSLKRKTELLDGAIAIGDGNAILTIVLFLAQTLKKKLMYQILSSRPIAVNIYINYLSTRMKTHEVTDLLVMLGRSGDAAIHQYQIIMESSGGSIDTLLNKLKSLSANYFSQPSVDPIYVKVLKDYTKLLEWQKCVCNPEVENKSVIQSLAYCCTHHWSDGAGKITAPQTICQQQQISPLQYDWTAVSVQAILKNWDVIENMFIKKNFLGRTTLSCSVPLPKMVGRLKELGANTILLAVYLNHISSVSQRLEIAIKYKVHRTVIDCFISQKDRLALTQYKMTLHPQSEEYFYAENALRSSTTKWKN